MTAAVTGMESPRLSELFIVAQLLVTTAASNTFRGRTAAQVYQRVRLTDLAGIRVDVAGPTLRQINQRAFGAGQVDPADISPSTSNAPENFVLRIPFIQSRFDSPLDFSPAAEEFAGCELVLTIAPALIGPANNQGTVQSGNFTVWGKFYDGGSRKTSSRLVYRDVGVQGNDFEYQLDAAGAQLVDMWLSAKGDDITTPTALAATNWFSTGLGYQSYPNYVLDDDYKRALGVLAAADDVAAGVAQAFYTSRRSQKITELPNFSSLQMKFDVAAPSSGVVAFTTINRRGPELSAAALKTSPADVKTSAPVIHSARQGRQAPKTVAEANAAAFLPSSKAS